MNTIDISCDCDAKHLTYSVTDSHGVTQLVSFCAECAHGAAADWDTDGAIVKIVRDEPADPAADQVGDTDYTVHVDGPYTMDEDEDPADWFEYQANPDEGDCGDVDDWSQNGPVRKHAWQDGPVRSKGGGVTRTDTCAHCGARRQVDTWQGHRIVAYLAAVSE